MHDLPKPQRGFLSALLMAVIRYLIVGSLFLIFILSMLTGKFPPPMKAVNESFEAVGNLVKFGKDLDTHFSEQGDDAGVSGLEALNKKRQAVAARLFNAMKAQATEEVRTEVEQRLDQNEQHIIALQTAVMQLHAEIQKLKKEK